ncbi:DUF3140 domain-containing protein [Rhodococcus sovatensis]|uniref:DUF3140 domain-containing protein n=1 Tax=Rhodococcus sovatensis TaxID=1805840 RepID=A0ABZ2PJR1_9NOCA
MPKDYETTYKNFRDAVNMTANELEKFLKSDDSKSVGQKKDSDESVGHESGRKIVHILETKKADLSEEDYSHMEKVVSYVHRHSAQRSSGDVADTPWRYSLMNWGHDPLKG